jgi:hypothetical protein
LINPLLAENMGRWAEVYFTTPPESREHAVLELLHELQAEKTRREALLASEMASQPSIARCENCGHENPAPNKFCGMCGAATATDVSRFYEVGNRSESNPSQDENGESGTWDDAPPSHEQSIAPRHELSLFQAYRETDADEAGRDWNYEPAPSSSYRAYIGVVLAIVILALGYAAWRGMQNSQSSRGVSAPPPPAAQTSEPEPPASAAPKSEVPAAKSDVPNAEGPAASNGTAAEPPKSPSEHSPAEPSNTTPSEVTKAPGLAHSKAEPTETAPTTKRVAPAEKSTQQAPSDRWGAEELSVAQRYLNGTTGGRRDTTEAAKWLWKSIAKHNSQATLLLADLYLKGDGVAKNCDQARILLDSAARKGVTGAGERLRNLPAFGCQ